MALTRLDLSTICPTPLKTIKKYLAVAWTCCEQQDVVSYWCMYIIIYIVNLNFKNRRNISVS